LGRAGCSHEIGRLIWSLVMPGLPPSPKLRRTSGRARRSLGVDGSRGIHVPDAWQQEKDLDGLDRPVITKKQPCPSMRIRGKFTGSYPFCSNFQHRIRELALPVLLILGKKTGVRGGIVKARMAAID